MACAWPIGTPRICRLHTGGRVTIPQPRPTLHTGLDYRIHHAWAYQCFKLKRVNCHAPSSLASRAAIASPITSQGAAPPRPIPYLASRSYTGVCTTLSAQGPLRTSRRYPAANCYQGAGGNGEDTSPGHSEAEASSKPYSTAESRSGSRASVAERPGEVHTLGSPPHQRGSRRGAAQHQPVQGQGGSRREEARAQDEVSSVNHGQRNTTRFLVRDESRAASKVHRLDRGAVQGGELKAVQGFRDSTELLQHWQSRAVHHHGSEAVQERLSTAEAGQRRGELDCALERSGGTAAGSGLVDTGEEMEEREPNIVVFSGGTAFNSVAGNLRQLTTRVAYVLPVSDDGGSTAEIVRVLGGPAVGDIRSRCLRLADDSDEEARAVKDLLAYRLPANTAAAKAEWQEIVEGDHPLWECVSTEYKAVIRSFLVHFHSQILRLPTPNFNFRNGSVGNFFFAGARLFFMSLEAAIFLFARVARIPQGSAVLPAINTDERITLAAQLLDGTIIRGQNTISHPCQSGSPGPIHVDKTARLSQPLPSPVSRIFYMSSEGTQREHEVSPNPNPKLLDAIASADAVVYGMGSLYTSICPALVLRGVGEAMAGRTGIPKVFLLNGSHDRETSACRGRAGLMRASDCVRAICDTLNRCESHGGGLHHPPTAYVTALLVPEGGDIIVDEAELHHMGITWATVASVQDPDGGVLYKPEALVNAIRVVVHNHVP